MSTLPLLIIEHCTACKCALPVYVDPLKKEQPDWFCRTCYAQYFELAELPESNESTPSSTLSASPAPPLVSSHL